MSNDLPAPTTAFTKSEPAVSLGGLQGAIGGVISAGILLAQSFGVSISTDQVVAILGLYSALAVAWGFLTRSQVRAVANSVSITDPVALQEVARAQHDAFSTGSADSMSAGAINPPPA